MLGVRLGDDLLVAPAHDNKYGYWEHRQIARIQDILLAELGRTWYAPRGVLPLPKGWLESKPTRAATEHLTELVAGELATAGGGLWGFKDPRTVRLLPMWQKILWQCNATPIYVLCVRQPESVVQSLVTRNAMSQAHARFLWLQHNLEAFARVGPQISAIVDYDLWFSRPARNIRPLLKATGAVWTMPSALQITQRALDRDERHYDGSKRAGSLADQVYQLILRRALRFYAVSRLHRISAKLDEAYTLLQSWHEIIDVQHPADRIPTEAWEQV
jgi:hypothetical protein